MLLELLDHSVHYNLAEEGKESEHSQMESIKMMINKVDKELNYIEIDDQNSKRYDSYPFVDHDHHFSGCWFVS